MDRMAKTALISIALTAIAAYHLLQAGPEIERFSHSHHHRARVIRRARPVPAKDLGLLAASIFVLDRSLKAILLRH